MSTKVPSMNVKNPAHVATEFGRESQLSPENLFCCYLRLWWGQSTRERLHTPTPLQPAPAYPHLTPSTKDRRM